MGLPPGLFPGDLWALSGDFSQLQTPSSENRIHSSILGPALDAEPSVDAQDLDRALSPKRSSVQAPELFNPLVHHPSKPLSSDSSATSWIDNSYTSVHDSTPRSLPPSKDYELIVPELESCQLCPYRGSAHGIAGHFKTSHHDRSSCAVFSCIRQSELGCKQVFRDERSRARHRQQSCKALSPQSFQCCCGGKVRHWANFVKGHRACVSKAGGLYKCHCKAQFADFKGLEDHFNENHRARKVDLHQVARNWQDDWTGF